MLSAEDRQARAGRISSSTCAAVLGWSPFATPLQAWEELTGRAPPRDEDEEPAHFERGNFLEPGLVRWCAATLERIRLHPHHVEEPRTRLVEDWAADSVDAVLRAKCIGVGVECVEAKTVNFANASGYGEDGTDSVPRHVALQCAWHMFAWDSPVCWVPALVGGGLELRLYCVRRDADIEEALVETCADWWRVHVQGDTPPSAAAGDEDVLRRLFPSARGEELPDDPAIAYLVRRDVELRAEIKKAEAARDEVRVDLLERLRDYDGCRGDWGSVTYRNTADRTSTDYRAIVRELDPSPEFIEKHTRVRPGPRVLRTTWKERSE